VKQQPDAAYRNHELTARRTGYDVNNDAHKGGGFTQYQPRNLCSPLTTEITHSFSRSADAIFHRKRNSHQSYGYRK